MTSLINTTRIVQGDSSDIYYFSSPDFTDFSDANWQANAVIRSGKISGNEIITIPLSKNDGLEPEAFPPNSRFVFKIDPDDSATLPTGSLHMSIEVKNLVLSFRREIVQTVLIVEESGVTN